MSGHDLAGVGDCATHFFRQGATPVVQPLVVLCKDQETLGITAQLSSPRCSGRSQRVQNIVEPGLAQQARLPEEDQWGGAWTDGAMMKLNQNPTPLDSDRLRSLVGVRTVTAVGCTDRGLSAKQKEAVRRVAEVLLLHLARFVALASSYAILQMVSIAIRKLTAC